MPKKHASAFDSSDALSGWRLEMRSQWTSEARVRRARVAAASRARAHLDVRSVVRPPPDGAAIAERSSAAQSNALFFSLLFKKILSNRADTERSCLARRNGARSYVREGGPETSCVFPGSPAACAALVEVQFS